MKTLASIVCFAACLAVSANAQEVSPFSFSVGAGFTQPVGNTGRNLDQGWNVGVGGGFNFGPYVGAMIDLGFNDFGVNSGTLYNYGLSSGNLRVFSATLDPIVHLTPHGRFDLYVTGGGGIYHEFQNFSAGLVSNGTGNVAGNPGYPYNTFFGPFPSASSSINKPGVDVGAGVAFGTKWHGKIFAEARYNRIFIGNFHTDYVPVSFGFRW
jgi:hypothetical protein